MTDEWLKNLHQQRRTSREQQQRQAQESGEKRKVLKAKADAFFAELKEELSRLVAVYNTQPEADADAMVRNMVVPGSSFKAVWDGGPMVTEVELEASGDTIVQDIR